jgi:hypothetical protein
METPWTEPVVGCGPVQRGRRTAYLSATLLLPIRGSRASVLGQPRAALSPSKVFEHTLRPFRPVWARLRVARPLGAGEPRDRHAGHKLPPPALAAVHPCLAVCISRCGAWLAGSVHPRTAALRGGTFLKGRLSAHSRRSRCSMLRPKTLAQLKRLPSLSLHANPTITFEKTGRPNGKRARRL